MEGKPDRKLLELGVARLLDEARARSGRTVPQMVEELSPLQPRATTGSKHRQRWYEWLRRPAAVSAVTLLRAAVLGRMPWAEQVMRLAAAEPRVRLDWPDPADQERRFQDLEQRLRELEGQREVVDELRALLGQMVSEGRPSLRRQLRELERRAALRRPAAAAGAEGDDIVASGA